jgi:hypothetical protein
MKKINSVGQFVKDLTGAAAEFKSSVEGRVADTACLNPANSLIGHSSGKKNVKTVKNSPTIR